MFLELKLTLAMVSDGCTLVLQWNLQLSSLRSVMSNLGQCLIEVGDITGAVETLEQSLALMIRWKPGDHTNVANRKHHQSQERDFILHCLLSSPCCSLLRLLVSFVSRFPVVLYWFYFFSSQVIVSLPPVSW